MLFGTYFNNLDSKGRVFLPAKFREDLGQSIMLVKTSEKCLSLYSESKWEEFCRKIMENGEISMANIMRKLSRDASRLEPDAQGRIIIPMRLREQMKLEGEISFVGMVNRVEVWKEDGLSEATDDITSDMVMQKLAEMGM